MYTPSRLAGAFVLPVLLAGCTGVPAVVEPAPVAPVAFTPSPPLQPAPVAPVIAYGSNCFAGFYQCALPVAVPVGSQCTCPGLGGTSYGTVR